LRIAVFAFIISGNAFAFSCAASLCEHEATGARFETIETERQQLPLGAGRPDVISTIDRVDVVHSPNSFLHAGH
jgi:hypothetical protein